MPSSPELSHCERSVGMVEISWKIESHYFSETDSHEGIAAEIEIKLERIGENSHPCQRRGNALIADH